MIRWIILLTSAALPGLLTCTLARAQDVPGIEICTVEKTMERRTSCLQSNVDFLQRTITRLSAEHQRKLDAADRQIEALKVTVVALQKTVNELQARKQVPEDKAAAAPPGTAPGKEKRN